MLTYPFVGLLLTVAVLLFFALFYRSVKWVWKTLFILPRKNKILQEQQRYAPREDDVPVKPAVTRESSSHLMKKSRNAIKLKYYLSTHKRVPGTDVHVYDVFLFLLLVLLNIGWVVFTINYWRVSDSLGYLACANSLLVIVPATRTSFLIWLFDLPVDRTIHFHRWIGRLVAFVASLHMVSYFPLWIDLQSSGTSTITHQLLLPKNLWGLGANVALLILVVTSLEYIRRKMYNTFFYSHFSFVIFYVFGSLHSPKFVPYVYGSFALYFTDKIFVSSEDGCMPNGL